MNAAEGEPVELEPYDGIELPQERATLRTFGPNYGEIRGAYPIREEWVGAGRSDFVDLSEWR